VVKTYSALQTEVTATTMLRPITIWILIASGVFSGCSSTATLYDNAPRLVREKIDDYFSISQIQELQLDRDLKAFAVWHRRIELPEYVDLLSAFDNVFADGLTREEIELLFEQFAAAGTRLAQNSLGLAKAFLATVTTEQLDHYDHMFYERFTEDQKILKLSKKERIDKRFAYLLDRLEEWFGHFKDDQLNKLRLINDALPDNTAYRLEQREQRHSEFLRLLSGKPDDATIEAYLHRMFVKRDYLNTEHREIRKHMQRKWQSAMLEIDQILTANQRQRALDRVSEYREDFKTLIKQSESEPQLPLEIKR
jgi:hypothetical protein